MSSANELLRRLQVIVRQREDIAERLQLATEVAQVLSTISQLQLECATLLREQANTASLRWSLNAELQQRAVVSLSERAMKYTIKAHESQEKFDAEIGRIRALEEEDAQLRQEQQATYAELGEVFEHDAGAARAAGVRLRSAPASEAIIASLPILHYVEGDEKASDGSELSMCAICHETLGEQAATKLSCAHEFHYDCVVSWLRRKNSCPLCRQQVTAANANNPPDEIQDPQHTPSLGVRRAIGSSHHASHNLVLTALFLFLLFFLAGRFSYHLFHSTNLQH